MRREELSEQLMKQNASLRTLSRESRADTREERRISSHFTWRHIHQSRRASIAPMSRRRYFDITDARCLKVASYGIDILSGRVGIAIKAASFDA